MRRRDQLDNARAGVGAAALVDSYDRRYRTQPRIDLLGQIEHRRQSGSRTTATTGWPMRDANRFGLALGIVKLILLHWQFRRTFPPQSPPGHLRWHQRARSDAGRSSGLPASILERHPSINHLSLIPCSAAGAAPPSLARCNWKMYYWPWLRTASGAGAIAVVPDEVVVLNGYPGGPFT